MAKWDSNLQTPLMIMAQGSIALPAMSLAKPPTMFLSGFGGLLPVLHGQIHPMDTHSSALKTRCTHAGLQVSLTFVVTPGKPSFNSL